MTFCCNFPFWHCWSSRLNIVCICNFWQVHRIIIVTISLLCLFSEMVWELSLYVSLPSAMLSLACLWARSLVNTRTFEPDFWKRLEPFRYHETINWDTNKKYKPWELTELILSRVQQDWGCQVSFGECNSCEVFCEVHSVHTSNSQLLPRWLDKWCRLTLIGSL